MKLILILNASPVCESALFVGVAWIFLSVCLIRSLEHWLWTGLASNSDLHSERMVTISLTCGMALIYEVHLNNILTFSSSH
jgi:hypothetical protein